MLFHFPTQAEGRLEWATSPIAGPPQQHYTVEINTQENMPQ